MLTVLRRSEQTKRGNHWATFWVCKCDCGNETIVQSNHLRSGHTQSCGCLKSSYEYKVNNLLSENNFQFKTQISFDNLRSEANKNQRFRFDYGIYNNGALDYLLEVDGEYHFVQTSKKGRLETQHKNDTIKNNYCFDNNIKLIRIPYTKVSELTADDLIYEKSKYKVTKDNINQYYVDNGLQLVG